MTKPNPGQTQSNPSSSQGSIYTSVNSGSVKGTPSGYLVKNHLQTQISPFPRSDQLVPVLKPWSGVWNHLETSRPVDRGWRTAAEWPTGKRCFHAQQVGTGTDWWARRVTQRMWPPSWLWEGVTPQLRHSGGRGKSLTSSAQSSDCDYPVREEMLFLTSTWKILFTIAAWLNLCFKG